MILCHKGPMQRNHLKLGLSHLRPWQNGYCGCLKLACGAERGWKYFLGRRSQWRAVSDDGPEMHCRNKLFGVWLTRKLGKELLYEVLGGEKVCGWVNGAGLG